MKKRTLIRDTIKYVGQTITVMGWVQARRDHGKIVFFDLRDRTGLLQVVVLADKAEHASVESVLEISGQIKERPRHLVNPNLKTGKIELEAQSVSILSKADTLPIPIDSLGHDIDEEIRLKYRYLDLRRPRMEKNIRIRHKVIKFLRDYLDEREFVEIETPILTKTTPEGARDFIVPSRLQPGNFYALPQSPQQYKQLLMVAGFENYYQIARCFRDEDPRADRAYGEFTQLDMEMSFVTQNDILDFVESMFTKLVQTLFPDKHITVSPWPRISHHEVINKYGSDKPDLRKNPHDPNELAFNWTVNFPLFQKQTTTDYYHGLGKAIFAPSHHMFTAPHPEDLKLLDSDPLSVRGLQHDLVLNGFEVGGGSIRIHQKELQDKVFELIGFTKEQKKQFDHMLTAFRYGVPPHGGIAPGIDRLLMILANEPNLREVIAFPAMSSGKTAVVEAPSAASPEQLQELGITVKHQKKA